MTRSARRAVALASAAHGARRWARERRMPWRRQPEQTPRPRTRRNESSGDRRRLRATKRPCRAERTRPSAVMMGWKISVACSMTCAIVCCRPVPCRCGQPTRRRVMLQTADFFSQESRESMLAAHADGERRGIDRCTSSRRFRWPRLDACEPSLFAVGGLRWEVIAKKKQSALGLRV